MFDYLQKYSNLSKEMRDKLSSPPILAALEKLEKKYGVYLATLVIKVMVKEIKISDLIKYFTEEFKLGEEQSRNLAEELKEKIFTGLSSYLALTEKTLPLGEVRGEGQLKPELPCRSSPIFFAPEDEKEIKDLAQKINGYFQGFDLESKIKEKLDSIIEKVKINFGSELLAGRFRYILRTYLRGIRNRIETKQALMKSIEIGGLGFDSASTDKILLIADRDSQDLRADFAIKPPVKMKLPEDKMVGEKIAALKDIGVRDVEYDFASLKRKPEKLAIDIAHELPPPSPPPPVTPPPAFRAEKPIVQEKFKTSPAVVNRLRSEEERLSLLKEKETSFAPSVLSQARVSPPSGGKVKMEDIKFEPKIMGPIEELKYMNTINFRRLNKDPQLAARIIKEKIDLLDEEYSRRIEGIKAWRINPLNRLYLEMGALSISNKKPVDAIIKERQAASQEYLTAEEFQAIIELNRELRF